MQGTPCQFQGKRRLSPFCPVLFQRKETLNTLELLAPRVAYAITGYLASVGIGEPHGPTIAAGVVAAALVGIDALVSYRKRRANNG